MPKRVDERVRRVEIAAALWRVIARDGIVAASARTIAAESGWSLGSVRYWFPSQAALLRFAAEEMALGVDARLRALWQGTEPGPDRARALLEQLLPLDEQRLAEVRAWLAMLINAHVDPELDELRRSVWQGERELCRLIVAEARALDADPERGPLPGPDEGRAALLHAGVDGLAVQAALVPEAMPAAVLRRELNRLLLLSTVSAMPEGQDWSS